MTTGGLLEMNEIPSRGCKIWFSEWELVKGIEEKVDEQQ